MAQIRLQFRPNGASCNHVFIRDSASLRILMVCTIPELRAAINLKSDNPLIVQIKRIARNSGITDPALLREHLELQDFEF